MRRSHTYLIALSGFMLLLFSCDNMGKRENHGPIVLGDSSSIVTETNAKNLQDMVMDLHPNIPVSTPVPTDTPKQAEKKPVIDTQRTANTEAKPAVLPDGLNVAFKEILFSIPGINTKSYRTQNLAKANGATYQLLSGSLNGKQIHLGNGTANKVSQRYQTLIVLKNDLGTLPLETLNNLTDWEELSGKNNTYTIAGLNGKLEGADLNLSLLQKAIKNAGRKHHLSKRSEQEWINSVRNTRNNKRTITVALRSVIWKIDGKDAGKTYSKQVRVDLPAPEFEKE